jgi:hypothetical protein
MDYTEIVVAIVVSLFGVAGTVASVMASVFIHKYVEDKKAAVLLENAVNNSLGVIQQSVEKLGRINRATTSTDITPGVQYVQNHAHEALMRFNITPQRIREKIESRMGLANIEANIALNASATPVVVKPIDPVPTNL